MDYSIIRNFIDRLEGIQSDPDRLSLVRLNFIKTIHTNCRPNPTRITLFGFSVLMKQGALGLIVISDHPLIRHTDQSGLADRVLKLIDPSGVLICGKMPK